MLTVVTGNVCSGKSTYVRDHATAGDLVVDTDVIAQALGSPVAHGHEETLRFVAIKARNTAVKEAVKVSDRLNVWIIDSCVPQWRAELYDRHDAQWVTLEVPLAELHARADRERPELWHTLIDEWAPRQQDAGPSWRNPWPGHLEQPRKPWRTPGYRKGAKGSTYERLRRQFLAGKTNCECGCGRPFVTDAPCTHARCLKRGTGCMFHPQYPTVQHTVHLVDGGPSLDVSTWQAWTSGCNTGDGGRVAQRRRAQRQPQRGTGTRTNVELDW